MSKYIKRPIFSNGTLYRPELEHDACGVGGVSQIDGTRSNLILKYALESACSVVHRGPLEADGKTGDGAGILTQIPYKLLIPAAEEMGANLANENDLGVGVFFLPTNEIEEIKAKILAEGVLRNRGLKVIGWRDVPVNPRELGESARASLPEIKQLLIGRGKGLDDDAYERALYLSRREIEMKVAEEEIVDFYIPSLSHRKIVYKALLVATQLDKFFIDLQHPEYETAIALYHQRFSTNTFPSWPLTHPFRMLAHNGEINTLRGNRNWMASRESDFQHEVWGDDVGLLHNLIDPHGSDSASLDSALELLVLSGRSVSQAMSILVPPAWRLDSTTTQAEKDYYRYYRSFTEPWDGPAALIFTDGVSLAATLDRNGLRPSRFKLTEDGIFTIGSEVGVVDLADETMVKKGRLAPGEMICVDTKTGKISYDRELKAAHAAQQPYGEWLKGNRVTVRAKEPSAPVGDVDVLGLSQRQIAFGYTKEEVDISFSPMLSGGEEATYSMGDDVSLSVLSMQPRVLSTYFRQLFAQVTNPPIDSIRERGVMSLNASLGWQRNLLTETPEHAEVIYLTSPFLFLNELEEIKAQEKFPHRVIDCTWPLVEGAAGLEKAVDRITAEAEAAIDEGVRVLILSDRAVDEARVPMPAVLATGAVHHHLSRTHKRMRAGIIAETGEARDTHQMACLFGFGATAVCPYLAYETAQELLEADKVARKPKFEEISHSYTKALQNYRKSLEKGVLKIMAKMGIGVLSSYQGAQIFEAVGIADEVMERCFKGSPSQLGGIGFEQIAAESILRHEAGFAVAVPDEGALKLSDPGYYRYRKDGETHFISGPTILKPFHAFVKDGDPEKYKEYVDQTLKNRPVSLHDLLDFVPNPKGPVPLDEVESIRDITVRFTTAAMSMGAISPEAHEALAIAMNSIGGKSDSGEGGEDPVRFNTNKNSKIKQIASGRFGVNAEYLSNAEELEIKMAQGAKPGEGGQLPGFKVTSLIARLRNTVPGVTLISPPPHHDIYSIEDLAQLIHDLKEVNPRARVCVKLVAKTGVGTIAAGVAKANADIILISGHDGGTGASPLSSIKHAGLPWEIGLSETQQVLMLNGLRDRVTLRTDGGMKNGRDIVMAACMGAEEYNFGTLALIALGCVYVRQCHLNTCPVGVATQDPKLRAKFKGDPQHVINFFDAVAQEVREIMAELGVRSLNELIGHTSYLAQRHVPEHPKANTLNLGRLLKDVAKESGEDIPRRCKMNRNDGRHAHPLDDKIIQQAHGAIRTKTPVELSYKVTNVNRNVGTKLSGEIAYIHGNHGLPDRTVTVHLEGSAGQSFGTFLCGGVKIVLTGEANDYVGKGMCGGEIVIKPRACVSFKSHENSIIGNTIRYGATGGKLFAAGRAGERFCVRNSGGSVVVEGIGDHGCEYMTGGVVAVLGDFGKNFGAGMSGGTAYLLDEKGMFAELQNPDMVKGEALTSEDEAELKALVEAHLQETGSARAKEILDGWAAFAAKFIKVTAKQAPNPPAYDEGEVKAEVAAN